MLLGGRRPPLAHVRTRAAAVLRGTGAAGHAATALETQLAHQQLATQLCALEQREKRDWT
jgi:hypothetical protein